MRGVQPSSVLEPLQKRSRRRHMLGRRSGWHARRRQKYRQLAGTQSAVELVLAIASGLHASARASMSANVSTLSTAFNISMSIEVVHVDAPVADNCWRIGGILRHSKIVHTEPDACGGRIIDRSWSGLLAGQTIRRLSLVLWSSAHRAGRNDAVGGVHDVGVRGSAVAKEHCLGPLGTHVAI